MSHRLGIFAEEQLSSPLKATLANIVYIIYIDLKGQVHNWPVWFTNACTRYASVTSCCEVCLYFLQLHGFWSDAASSWWPCARRNHFLEVNSWIKSYKGAPLRFVDNPARAALIWRLRIQQCKITTFKVEFQVNNASMYQYWSWQCIRVGFCLQREIQIIIRFCIELKYKNSLICQLSCWRTVDLTRSPLITTT